MNAQTPIAPEFDTLLKLREPFPPNQISKLPKETRSQIDARKTDKTLMVWKCPECGGPHHKNAVHLDYVGHAAATDRLLDTDLQWTWEPLAVDQRGLPAFDDNGGLWIKLTVCGVTRLGYGSADGKSGGDAKKEIIGDAIRNAGMRFGMALDLWHKGDLHAEDEATPSEPAAVQLIDDGQRDILMTLSEQSGVDLRTLCNKCKIKALPDLPAEKFRTVRDWLETKLKAKGAAGKAPPPDAPAHDVLDDEIPY